MCRNSFDKEQFSCKAFPDGIPDEILSGKDKHKEPYDGQENNLVFEPK